MSFSFFMLRYSWRELNIFISEFQCVVVCCFSPLLTSWPQRHVMRLSIVRVWWSLLCLCIVNLLFNVMRNCYYSGAVDLLHLLFGLFRSCLNVYYTCQSPYGYFWMYLLFFISHMLVHLKHLMHFTAIVIFLLRIVEKTTTENTFSNVIFQINR